MRLNHVEQIFVWLWSKFIGDKNYLVLNINTYNVGILIAMPYTRKYHNGIQDEYNSPTSIENQDIEGWYLETVKNACKINKVKSSLELMFCMLRSK